MDGEVGQVPEKDLLTAASTLHIAAQNKTDGSNIDIIMPFEVLMDSKGVISPAAIQA